LVVWDPPIRALAAGVAGALGGLALLLTAIGLYSVASYSVVQRRREIGVLVALGASPSQVIRRILSEAWRCVVLGVAAGLPVCLVLSKLAASSVLQIRTFDPGAYLSVPALLIVITTLACAGPARRAARIDPMASLRESNAAPAPTCRPEHGSTPSSRLIGRQAHRAIR
jgi:ABC-type antimicrobial peptide transport system permease subunit